MQENCLEEGKHRKSLSCEGKLIKTGQPGNSEKKATQAGQAISLAITANAQNSKALHIQP